jgi:hypothetical protein
LGAGLVTDPKGAQVDAPESRRKAHDRSIALVWVGIAFLMPPIAGISLIDDNVGGIPFPLLYVFIVWAVLIAGAAALARPLRDSDKSTSGPAETPDPID